MAAAVFTNVYYKRTVGTPKQCYICYKPTSTVLATINTVDFIYTCPGHLQDPGFAIPLGSTGEGSVGPSGAKKMGLSPEELDQIKKEWEEGQKRKREKKEREEKEKALAEEGSDGKKQSEQSNVSSVTQPTSSTSTPGSHPSSPPPSATPTHERYALHRDIFQMRLTEHRKRRQVQQTREIAPRLPGAPRGGLA